MILKLKRSTSSFNFPWPILAYSKYLSITNKETYTCHILKIYVSFIGMKYFVFSLISMLFVVQLSFAQKQFSNFITTDINHFWEAYDQIIATKDSAQQYQQLNKLFLEKGTPGLKAMMQARNYTAKSYIDAIKQRQKYFESIRENMLKADKYAGAIDQKVEQLRKLYPALKPATIYFTVGAFRSGGTTSDSLILIGSEIAMSNEHLGNLVFTNIHEYVHTQQKTTQANNLLGQCVMEGVAEFMAEKVMETNSTVPAFVYGKENVEKVKQVFAKQLFNESYSFWLYSDVTNEFGQRDMGYYIGYAIAEQYYKNAADKQRAIKEMIELDYNDEKALFAYVDKSGFFKTPMAVLKKTYEKNRPVVLSVSPFESGQLVDPNTSKITINFSTAMDKRYRNFELGPLGKDYLLVLKSFISFALDGKSVTFELDTLKPNQRYQILVGKGFRDLNGVGIKTYLIDFKTRE
ncbi:Ig-like domain-containing protein [Pedobacter montanisoli]|uniref:Ig-like domain-containing protein n=1 Tax=Pedobacter montanisoli TaxID=2923277 RepID=A0ABS9ZYW0_9SPHI|nr:Ig-like domain-containing protein [Pedobacter montanisoli]MCJ0743503.1 Ig-like domain-containing protein [Pedobacter montanisoli]